MQGPTRGGDASSSPVITLQNNNNNNMHHRRNLSASGSRTIAVDTLMLSNLKPAPASSSTSASIVPTLNAVNDTMEDVPAIAIDNQVQTAKAQKSSKDLWFLHGKYYDLAPFIDSHPGGVAILKMTQGIEDATPLMESYHAFANKDYIAKTLAKYEVPYVPEDAETRRKTETAYTFEPNGFYMTLTRRVRAHFGSTKENESVAKKVKANYWWALKTSVQLLVFVSAYSVAFLVPDTDKLVSCLAAALAGVMIIAIGMTCMHDASHYAIAVRDSWKNKLILRIWTACAFWDPSMWLYHHTVRHHAFTGDAELDPDTQHAKPFIRKHLNTSRSKYLAFPRVLAIERWFWAIYAMAVYTLSPGMYIGQIISYRILWPLKGRLWKMGPVPKGSFQRYLWEDLLTLAMIAPHLYKASPLVSFVFFTMCNIAYAICIVPDHDTFESAVENHVHGGRVDWGEIQVRHSSDFGGKGFLGRCFTQMFGGINVQIGHHLFPSVNHVFLPELVPIIRETCAEFSIPYADQGSVASALWSFVRTIHACMGIDEASAKSS